MTEKCPRCDGDRWVCEEHIMWRGAAGKLAAAAPLARPAAGATHLGGRSAAHAEQFQNLGR